MRRRSRRIRRTGSVFAGDREALPLICDVPEKPKGRPVCGNCTQFLSKRAIEVGDDFCAWCRKTAETPTQHGTKAGYRAGCDCGPCVAAASSYTAEWKARRERVPA